MGAYVYYVSLLVDRDTFYIIRFGTGALFVVVECVVSKLVGMRVVVVYAAIIGTYI